MRGKATSTPEAEERLQAIKDRIITLADRIPAYIAQVNADTMRYEFVNEAYERAFEIPRDKILGSHVREVIGEAGFQFAMTFVEQVKAGRSVSYEREFPFASGPRWLEVTYSPLLGPAGEVKSIAVLNFDITERKHAEDALARSEGLQKIILDSLQANVVTLDPAGNIVSVNEPWRRFAQENGVRQPSGVTENINYLEVVRKSAEAGDSSAGEAFQGLQEVLVGTRHAFEIDYPCHSPFQQRWFRMKVTSLEGPLGGAVVVHENITLRKQASEEVLAAKNQLESLTSAVPGAVYQFRVTPDGEWKFIYVSKGIEDLFEVCPLEAVQDHNALTQRIHPEDRVSHRESVERAVREQSPWLHEHRIITPSGKLKWVRGQAHLERQADGGILWNGILSDISAHKRLEMDLEESMNHYRLLSENSSDGVALFENGKVKYVSENYLKISGYDKHEIIDISIEGIFQKIHVDDAIRIREIIRKAHSNKLTQFNYQYRIQPKSGTCIWLEDSINAEYDQNGSHFRSIIHSRDITDRKQAEEAILAANQKLALHFDQTPLAVIEWDRNFCVTRWNPAAESIFGFSAAEAIGQHANFILPEAAHPHIEPVLHQLLQGTGGSRSTNENRCKGGELILCEWYNTSLRDASGQILGVASQVQDISERKRIEAEKAELEALNRQLQKAESLGLMAGSIAHHFNNKLQAVMASLEALRTLPNSGDRSKYVAMAKLATEKAAAVSKQMLIYLGNSPGEREPLYLGELCTASLPLLRQALPQGVTLESSCPELGPVTKANAEHLQQILSNLVTNAGEAMGAAGGSVRLSLGTCLAAKLPTEHRFPVGWHPLEPEYAYLEVADTGVGIVSMDFERLFDPFFSTKFTGRGLGLSVVLGLVQAHAGAITVASQPVHGSVFRVYLPLSTDVLPSPPERALQATGYQGGGTLLLVDDDDMLLTTTSDLLEMLGFNILTAKDGAEALELFRQHRTEIRCVLTDLTMPRLDGWELLTALRGLDPNLPVILASGYDKAKVLAGTHPEHPQAFLSKPFGLQQLRDALAQALATGHRA